MSSEQPTQPHQRPSSEKWDSLVLIGKSWIVHGVHDSVLSSCDMLDSTRCATVTRQSRHFKSCFIVQNPLAKAIPPQNNGPKKVEKSLLSKDAYLLIPKGIPITSSPWTNWPASTASPNEPPPPVLWAKWLTLVWWSKYPRPWHEAFC